jgi:hypothetical protein
VGCHPTAGLTDSKRPQSVPRGMLMGFEGSRRSMPSNSVFGICWAVLRRCRICIRCDEGFKGCQTKVQTGRDPLKWNEGLNARFGTNW